MRIGTLSVRPGQRRSGQLVLGHYPDGPIVAPLTVVRGKRPGKTLWIQGCLHGQEVGGTVGLIRFLERLDPARIEGAVIAVKLANPLAFRGYARNTPIDGINLNRVFPGDAAGYHSQQVAHALMSTAIGHADALVDLHSGGESHIVPFYALYRDDGSAASREAGRLARAAATADIWASRDAWLDGALLTHFTLRGKPAVIVECGGGGGVSEQQVANFAGALEGMARALGILPGRPPRRARYRVMDQALLVYNRKGGLFRPAVEPGAVVRKGQALGAMLDFDGRVVETLVSPNGPAYVAALPRRYMALHSGALIAETIRIVEGG
ncbi:MAG: hypothetical protein FJX46_01395 [Alphaproteobacteria bacterium]|nr:hypothetical protein [Alphaproteobacteria bacterium]